MTDEPNNLPGAACLPLADPNPPRLTPTDPHLFQLRLFQLSDDPYDEPKTLGTIHGAAPWSITPADEALAEGFAAPQIPVQQKPLGRAVVHDPTRRLRRYRVGRHAPRAPREPHPASPHEIPGSTTPRRIHPHRTTEAPNMDALAATATKDLAGIYRLLAALIDPGAQA